MANVQSGPIHGIGSGGVVRGVVPGASQTEKITADQQKLKKQFEDAERIRREQARQTEIQRQYAERAAQQAKQKQNPSFLGNVATATVAAGVTAVVAGEVAQKIEQNPELLRNTREKLAEFLEAPTPASTALLGANKAQGPNTPTSNAKQLNVELDQTAHVRTVLDQYGVKNNDAREMIENDTREVAAAFRAIQEGQLQTTPKQIDDTNNVLIDFHRTVESTSLRALTQEQQETKVTALSQLGTSTKDLERAKQIEAQLQEQAKAQAKAIADEATAQVVRDNRQQSEYLRELDRANRQREAQRLETLTKEQTAQLAAEQRQAQGIDATIKATGQNVDPKTLTAIEQQRAAQGLQTDPTGLQQGPSLDKEGNYVDPNQKAQADLEIDQETGKFDLDYHEVRAFTGQGTADYQGNWTQKDVGAAMTSSLGHSRDAKPTPGDEKSSPIVPQGIDSIDRGDGQIEAWGRDVPIRRFGPENDPS